MTGPQLAPYPLCVVAAPTADGINNLFAVVVEGAEEYPTLEAVEAAPALLAAVLLHVGGGWVRALR